ncbi:MerR family transcriptional regulator [Arhodomonas sp. AD133]|uniref:MerR family transcriptional regulator n=1 Tax=Arhodomonas sp. AD133 TaxID=3415009 RepID=UPI003EC14493
MKPKQHNAVNGTTYTISQLAREFGVTTRAIRFYENRGLLAPRREGQKRIYSRRDRTRLKLTLRGKRLGMTLAEIKEVFDLYDMAHGEERQLERYLEILQAKRAMLLQQRQDLEDALAELEESMGHCRGILEQKREREEQEHRASGQARI